MPKNHGAAKNIMGIQSPSIRKSHPEKEILLLAPNAADLNIIFIF